MVDADILEVLGNEYNPEILRATHEPKSAKDLSDSLDIPIATCYRRIEELAEADLLDHDGRPLSDEHRRINVYRRTVEGIQIEFSGEDCTVTLEEQSDITDKLDEAWRGHTEV